MELISNGPASKLLKGVGSILLAVAPAAGLAQSTPAALPTVPIYQTDVPTIRATRLVALASSTDEQSTLFFNTSDKDSQTLLDAGKSYKVLHLILGNRADGQPAEECLDADAIIVQLPRGHGIGSDSVTRFRAVASMENATPKFNDAALLQAQQMGCLVAKVYQILPGTLRADVARLHHRME